MPTVERPEQIALLKEATHIAKNRASSAAPSNGTLLADVIQETYDKMIEIREKM